ncbi:hypothetical protein MTR_7g053370 [Medicago truncatula]|uniref:Uncharacterized protein n=1 Tax=Medicago truncatula TaxID=3880 RepID=A0A072TZC7_MEDTR|nr:hypothetical protein MTR_7g053370 [Medicago truncatula]
MNFENERNSIEAFKFLRISNSLEFSNALSKHTLRVMRECNVTREFKYFEGRILCHGAQRKQPLVRSSVEIEHKGMAHAMYDILCL